MLHRARIRFGEVAIFGTYWGPGVVEDDYSLLIMGFIESTSKILYEVFTQKVENLITHEAKIEGDMNDQGRLDIMFYNSNF